MTECVPTSTFDTIIVAVQNATRRFSLTIGLDRDKPPSPVLKSPLLEHRANYFSPSIRRHDRAGSVPVNGNECAKVFGVNRLDASDNVRRYVLYNILCKIKLFTVVS